MARKIRKNLAVSQTSGTHVTLRVTLAACVVCALCAALGSAGTYFALRPARIQAAAVQAQTAQAARMQGDQYEDHGQWAEAVTSYQSAIAAGLDNPDLRTDLGVAYFRSDQPQKALEQYAIAQKQNPEHENSLFNEASAYAVLGDSPRAISLWQQYLQKFPHGQHIAAAQDFIKTVQAHGMTDTAKKTRLP